MGTWTIYESMIETCRSQVSLILHVRRAGSYAPILGGTTAFTEDHEIQLSGKTCDMFTRSAAAIFRNKNRCFTEIVCVCVSVCTETKYNRYWWSSNKQHIRHCNLIAFHILQSTITVLHMLQHFYRFEHTESGRWVLHVSLSVCTGASSSCKCARGFSWPWWNNPRIGFIRILPCGLQDTLNILNSPGILWNPT